ncbi:MAG: glycosyltransferase family 2 protein [Candidatus Bathyarchaeota archaeon]|nr:glycosyltransferase family 2 protein [Candidatus Bathyarchaeum sp.]
MTKNESLHFKCNQGQYPLVSIVLLNYNGLRYLGALFKDCLESIMATDYPNFEVIFVDNGSIDGSDVVAQQFFEGLKPNKNLKGFKIIHNDENIIATGYNKGMKFSKGDYIALLSNDMKYHSMWLRAIIEEMEKDNTIGVAGCKRYVYGTSNIIDGLGGNLCIDGRPSTPARYEKDIGQYETSEDMDWIGGAAVIRRDVLQKIGLFDADYVIFYEDTDLCYKARKTGYRVVYVPKAKLWHKTTSTINNALITKQREYSGERSRIRFAIIHFAFARMLSTFLLDLILILVVDAHWKKTLLKAYWWNILNLSHTLKRRLEFGPSPPYSCKYPLFYWDASKFIRKLFKSNINE